MFACLSCVESLDFRRASTTLSRRKYCIEKEGKSEQKQSPRSRRAGIAQHGDPIFNRARARTTFFLTALSLCEFRRATEQAVTVFANYLCEVLQLTALPKMDQ